MNQFKVMPLSKAHHLSNRWLLFQLRYRDVIELLRDQGITVRHATVMRWVHHYLKVDELMRPIFVLRTVGPICIVLLTVAV